MLPEEIQYVNAHGTSTKKNDLFETIAYKSTFGEHARKLRISSIKVSYDCASCYDGDFYQQRLPVIFLHLGMYYCHSCIILYNKCTM